MTNAIRAIRFIRADLDVAGGDHCTAEVEIDCRGVGAIVGTAEGGVGEQDQLRAVARATSDALSDAFDAKSARVRVIGVHLVDAVAQTFIVVSLAASKGTTMRNLLGVCDGTTDPIKATALAVLNATNRFLDRD